VKACADGNAAALDAGLDAVRAMLTIADVSYAEKVAEDMLGNLTTKGLGGRPKAAERATECCMLLIELEQCDAVLDALLKASLNRIPKLALAATNAVLMAVTSFGTPKVVPASAILKGLAPLFDAKDAKVRSTAKDITVEMTKWLGAQAVKRDLIDKMREAMQADVNKAISSVEANARPTRFLRKDQAAQDSAMASTSGDDGSAVVVQKPSRDTETTTTTAPVAAPDAYDYSEPESILPLLEKPGEGENPKFWDGIVSKKWQERLYALQTLTKLASAPKLSSGDYGDVSKALKQVITKDSNVACIAEAARAAAALAKGARKEWTRDARILLPGMLDKLKDKTAAVIAAIQDALSESVKYCFELAEIVDEVCAALAHKVPKVQIETLKWLERTFEYMTRSSLSSLHKVIVPPIVKCTSASNADARNGALQTLATCAKASGGMKSIEFLLMDIDAGKKSKIEELMSGAPKAGVLAPNPPSVQQSSMIGKVAPPASGSVERAMSVKPSDMTGTAKRQTIAVKASTEEVIVELAPTISKDDAEARIVALLSEEVIHNLKSADWKARLAGMSSVVEIVTTLKDTSGDACDALVIGLASFPGWSDSNFQVMDKMFETLKILSAQPCFEYRHVAAALDVLGEKLSCFKLGTRASDSLLAFSEALGPRIIMSRLREKTGNSKAPKVVVGALNWASSTVEEFGVECLDTDMLVAWGRDALETPNPMIKGGGAKLLGALHAGIGPSVKDSLAGLKDAQLRSLEVEFARNPFEGEIKAKRQVRMPSSVPCASRAASIPSTTNAPPPNAAVVEAPRADISAKINDSFLSNMNDSNWKTRAAALEELGNILRGANNRITPTGGDLFKALNARFADSNRMLAVTALNIAGELALAIGSPIDKVGRGTLCDIVKYFGDSKKNVREAALKACTCWVTSAGLAKVLPTMAEKFQEYSAKITAEGKKEAIEWCMETYGRDQCADDVIHCSAVHFAAVGLNDKATESRKASAALMEAISSKVDADKVLTMAKSLGKELKIALEAHLNRSKPATNMKSAAMAVMATNALKGSAAARNAARKAAALGGGVAKSTDAPVMVQSGPVFLIDADKAVRIRKYPRKAMKFETLRDEDLMLLSEDVKSASRAYFRADVHKMMFTNDVKARLAALDSIDEAIKSDEAELVNSFDLLLRWLMLLISEASPNTQVMNRVLDVVLDSLHAASDLDYKIVEQEAAILLPVIVEKSGHSIESVREKFRSIYRAVPTVYLASKFVGYLTTGVVETKSSRTRAECLEEIGRLIERHGLLVCLREDKTLQEVAKLVETRDMSLRNCALNCLASAYKVAGDGVWKRVGKVSNEQVKDVISDKFARVAREMSLSNEGTPGDWLKFDPIPIASALDGASLSKSVDASTFATAKLADMMSSASIRENSSTFQEGKSLVSQSMHVLPSRTPFALRQEETTPDVEMSSAPAPVVPDVFVGANTPKAPSKPVVSITKDLNESTWSKALKRVNDVDESVAVEAMKSVCHEIVRAKEDVVAHAAMVGDIDGLVHSLAKRIEHVFVTAIASPAKGTRACRYILNALMQVHQDRAFATAITEPTQRAFIKQLLLILLDERVLTLEDGESLIKAANMLMIAMMENCTRSYSFVAFLTLLHDRPLNVPAHFDGLLVKCLIKLTRSMQLSFDNVHIPTVLGGIHTYLVAIGIDEINARAKVEDQGLRAVKTLLHTITTRVGEDVFKYCTSVPPRSAVPSPMIYSFIDVNLMAPKSNATPSAKSSSKLQTSPGVNAKSRLVAIFKKIGEKQTTSQGLEELYLFTQEHPEEDLTPQLERTSEAFQMYIKRGLQKVEAARLRKSPSNLAGAAPIPSPVAEAKSSAAAYRERLAQIQDNVGADVAAPTKVVDVDEAMTDLQRLRQRMNSINAKAAGTM
jgi:cytoskeleton-associated protein 5